MRDSRLVFRDALRRRLESLDEEEAGLRRQYAAVRSRLEEVERRKQLTKQLFELEFGSADEAPRDRIHANRASRFAGATWNQSVLVALREGDGPSTVEELWRNLQSGGFRSSSMNPKRTLLVVLSRHPGVRRVGRGLYRAIDEGSFDDGASA